VNVRNRDLQSVVKDIQQVVNENITLMPGTYITYGGQFENLQNATNRLLIAVPVALLLIFIFLHFAFKSLKDAIMIFSAIPLATVGGVLLLWIRGMPFSVSAGVGFIALFGIAVLNGIVLIEHLKELHQDETRTLRELIIRGARNRLRPVMLTAGAAAMGFLPMALSTGAGAEVQRPLATVVIGGLFTSTMLTMIALPLLYEVFYNVIGVKFFPFRFIRRKSVIMICFLLLLPFMQASAQDKEISLNEAIRIALENNKEIKAYELKSEEKSTLISTAFDIDKTFITYGLDENNIAENNYPLQVWGIQQSFSFPTLYRAEFFAKKIESKLADLNLKLQTENVIKNVSMGYIEQQVLNEKLKIMKSLDSLYLQLIKNASIRNKNGELSNLSLLNMQAGQQKMKQQFNAVKYEIDNARTAFKMMLRSDNMYMVSAGVTMLSLETSDLNARPFVLGLKAQEDLNEVAVQIEKNKMLPDISLNYFIGTNYFEQAKYYQGFEVGISVPLFFNAGKSKIKASKLARDAASLFVENEIGLLMVKQKELLNKQLKYNELIDSYIKIGSKLYDEIIRTTTLNYENGEIGFVEFAASIENALKIKIDYLNNLIEYNRVTLELNYLSK
jgi:cobalt-zinc-cadmium resistance protein CzcA